MNNHSKVSIITVCLNSGEHLEKAIKSVLGQSYKNIEYIIIDGGSTDGTIDVLNRYRDRIDKLVIEKDSGIYEAMNKGIRSASGESIYFLNSSDTLYDNKAVEDAVEFLETNKKIDFIYGDLIIFNPERNVSYIEKYPRKISKIFFVKRSLGPPVTFFRSICFKKAGYFNQTYKIAADYEWYIYALFIKGLRARHISRIISIFRLGGKSTAKRYAKLYFFERNSIEKKYFNVLEIIYARFFYTIKKLLGKTVTEFLHALRVNHRRIRLEINI